MSTCVSRGYIEFWPKETSKSMLSEATGSVKSETESGSASGSDVISLQLYILLQ